MTTSGSFFKKQGPKVKRGEIRVPGAAVAQEHAFGGERLFAHRRFVDLLTREGSPRRGGVTPFSLSNSQDLTVGV